MSLHSGFNYPRRDDDPYPTSFDWTQWPPPPGGVARARMKWARRQRRRWRRQKRREAQS